MTDPLLRWLSGSRAGGQDDYDVIGADGLVIRPHADARLRADARRPCRHRQELARRDVRPSGKLSGRGDEPRAFAQTTHAGPRWRGATYFALLLCGKGKTAGGDWRKHGNPRS